MLILLTVLAVGMLSMASISSKSTGINSAEQRARSNARMALMMAIDRLQAQMGPDQRVSASASILSDSTVANPYWVGVWDSWRAGGGTYDRYPDALSSHSTIFKGRRGDPISDSMHPTYVPNREDHFREWLVSLNDTDAALIDSGRNLSLNARQLPTGSENAVILVGEGSLGSDTPPDQFVEAALIPVEPAASKSKFRGRYGWWVGDNSQKAIIMADRYDLHTTLTAAEKLFRLQAPGSTGTRVAEGLQNITNEDQLKAVASLQTLDLLGGVGGKPSEANFHAITTDSFGVLADVREGGLKRDLTTLLERPLNPDERTDAFMLYKFNTKDTWANNTTAYPTLPDTPQECVPIQDLAAYYQLYDQSRKGGIQYGSSALPDAIQVMTPDYGTPHADYQTAFKQQYTTLYRNPVPVKVQFLLSLRKDDITQADRDYVDSRGRKVNEDIPATDDYKLRLIAMPAITMWNPYNVPLVMRSGESECQQIIVKPPTFWIESTKVRSDGSTYSNTTLSTFDAVIGVTSGRGELIRLNFGRTEPIVFEPGEVKVFSVPYNTSGQGYLEGFGWYHGHQTMSSPKNLRDAKQGWDPLGYFTLPNSAAEPRGGRRTTDTENRFNVLEEPGPRHSLTLDSGDELAIKIIPESAGHSFSRATSPCGSALVFYMAGRHYSAQGLMPNSRWKGYGWLNMRHHSLVSRFGGDRRAPVTPAFNNDLLRQGIPGQAAGLELEPVPVSSIAGATNAGESWPIMQFALMAGCETNELANGGAAAGRKFISRPFLHSSPFQPTVIDHADATAPYNHGWNWWMDEMNSVLEALVQETRNGNGYYGGGYSSESGATHVVQQEIPVTPPISIAALSHARIGGFTLAGEAPVAEGLEATSTLEGNGRSLSYQPIDNPSSTLGFQRVTAHGQGGLYPHVLQAIGNSYANPNLDAGVAYNPRWMRHCDADDGERPVTFADHSYLANKALWDEYFFSSIAPQPATVGLFEGEGRTAKEVAEEFFLRAGQLPNRRLQAYLVGLDQEKLDEHFTQKDYVTGGFADKVASHLMVHGPFNVNSTSVEAWKILFSSLKDKPIAYLNGGTEPLDAATDGKVPVGMGTLPTGLPVGSGGTDDPASPGQWRGARVITDVEIDALAQAMVREVRKRGPFLSLSEFVNRRLDPNNTDGMALKGALQAALDYDGSDGAGPEVEINKGFREIWREMGAGQAARDFAFPDAARGPAAYGSSAYVDQADILRNFAAQLAPRGDTFTIRAYGDSLDARGQVEARAWCEAVVQRIPEYLDGADEDHVKTSDLVSKANLRFGRKIQIVSFRWLNASEV